MPKWNSSTPSGGSYVGDGAKILRELKQAFKNMYETEHEGIPISFTSSGKHKQGSLKASWKINPLSPYTNRILLYTGVDPPTTTEINRYKMFNTLKIALNETPTYDYAYKFAYGKYKEISITYSDVRQYSSPNGILYRFGTSSWGFENKDLNLFDGLHDKFLLYFKLISANTSTHKIKFNVNLNVNTTAVFYDVYLRASAYNTAITNDFSISPAIYFGKFSQVSLVPKNNYDLTIDESYLQNCLIFPFTTNSSLQNSFYLSLEFFIVVDTTLNSSSLVDGVGKMCIYGLPLVGD